MIVCVQLRADNLPGIIFQDETLRNGNEGCGRMIYVPFYKPIPRGGCRMEISNVINSDESNVGHRVIYVFSGANLFIHILHKNISFVFFAAWRNVARAIMYFYLGFLDVPTRFGSGKLTPVTIYFHISVNSRCWVNSEA